MTKFFKIIATLEGLSLLLLFFVAMPMKYIYGNETLIRPAGMAHGVLFIGYIILAYLLKEEQNWSFKKFFIVAIASIIPFGTFYIEWKYLKDTQKN
jgi:integral membrane protein